jgi:ectoine hydroxylase-related dioxygenase (phytanoyl-CoA dioxygenase family)
VTGATANWVERIQSEGVGIAENVLAVQEIEQIKNALGKEALQRSRAGVRHALQLPSVAALARDERLLTLARQVLGPKAMPFRATLFDKSPSSNWLVVWHQDTALPLRSKSAVAGWGPWSTKEGVIYAHAPAHALSRILALRLQLDDCTAENGPLRCLPSTHTHGVLSDDEIEGFVQRVHPSEFLVPAGSVMGMRPLVIHASSKSRSELPRRVLHFEYSAADGFDGLELAIA